MQTTVTIPFKPTTKQKEIHDHPARFKVAVWGRRSGKSTYALNKAIKTCLETGRQRVWIVCPTYGQAKDIYWRDANMLDKYLLGEMGAKKNETELFVEFANKSVLQFKGADRPETLRGSGLDYMILDEFSEWRYAKETWETILLPALADKNGEALIIGTPKGENYFKQLYDLGQSGNSYWMSWRVPTWESGAPWTLTDEGKAFLENERLNKAEDWYMQEYGADFRKFTGLVFKEFERAIHVKAFEPVSRYDLMLGLDFGYNDPTVCIFAYIDVNDILYVVDEYYETQLVTREHAGKILATREKYDNGVRGSAADSEAKQTINDFAAYGLFVTPAKKDKGSVVAGIDRIADRLKVNVVTGLPRIIIHPRCVNLIHEFEIHKWKEVKGLTGEVTNEPEDGNDHCIDALRYIVNTFLTKKQAKDIPTIRNPYKPHGGYF